MLVGRDGSLWTYARIVIAIDFDAAALSRIRLAMSPAFEAVAWLSLAATGSVHPVLGDLRTDTRYAMRYPDVRLVAELVSGYPVYIPDFLTPKPIIGRPGAILDDQLAAVAETPPDIMRDNFDYATTAGLPVPPEVMRAVEDGTLPRRAANGIAQFWRMALASRWPQLRDVLERDLSSRSQLIADGGMARVLRTLHAGMRWTGAALHIGHEADVMTQTASEELVLVPSVVAWPHLFIQVTDPTNAVLCYPAARIGTAFDRASPTEVTAEHGARGNALVELLGESRAAVLLDLDRPRTTAALSSRRQLAAATVSYHLTTLVNAGLVLRKREGRQVLYTRSGYGDLLLEAVFGSAV